MKRHALLVALLSTSWLAGCHRVTFVNGPTEAAGKPVFEEHLNSAIVANVVDIDPLICTAPNPRPGQPRRPATLRAPRAPTSLPPPPNRSPSLLATPPRTLDRPTNRR
jgi:hypothetical protein